MATLMATLMHPKSRLNRSQPRARFLLRLSKTAIQFDMCVATSEQTPEQRSLNAFTDFTTTINISVIERERWGRGTVSACRVYLRRRVLCVRCKRMCPMQGGGPSPSTPVSGAGRRGSAGGNVFRRVHVAGLRRRSACQSLLYTPQFSAGLHPHWQSSILTVDPFNSRASLTCSCAQDFNSMKVSELKVLLRDVSQPVKYSSNECCPWICDFVSIKRFTEHTWQGNEESPRPQVGAIAGPSYIHFYLHKCGPACFSRCSIPSLSPHRWLR